MKPEHFPFRPGDHVTLLTYANNQTIGGIVLGLDEEGVTIRLNDETVRWNPWNSISGATGTGMNSQRVNEIINAYASRRALAATGVHPALADTVDTPPEK